MEVTIDMALEHPEIKDWMKDFKKQDREFVSETLLIS